MAASRQRDPFRRLNRDLAFLGAAALAGAALVGAGAGVCIDVLIHHHRARP